MEIHSRSFLHWLESAPANVMLVKPLLLLSKGDTK